MALVIALKLKVPVDSNPVEGSCTDDQERERQDIEQIPCREILKPRIDTATTGFAKYAEDSPWTPQQQPTPPSTPTIEKWTKTQELPFGAPVCAMLAVSGEDGGGKVTRKESTPERHVSKPPASVPRWPKQMESDVREICYFWYHYGHCRRKNDRVCPYWHRIDTNVQQECKVVNPWIDMHRRPCFKTLCPMKNGRKTYEQDLADKKQKRSVESKNTTILSTSPTSEMVAHEHTNQMNIICFSWYHRYCKLPGCQFAHFTALGLIVVPPNGVVHERPCDLARCPLKGEPGRIYDGKGRSMPPKTPLPEKVDFQVKATVGNSADNTALTRKKRKLLRWKAKLRAKRKADKLESAQVLPCRPATETLRHTREGRIEKPNHCHRFRYQRPLLSRTKLETTPEGDFYFSDEEYEEDNEWFLDGFPAGDATGPKGSTNGSGRIDTLNTSSEGMTLLFNHGDEALATTEPFVMQEVTGLHEIEVKDRAETHSERAN